MTRCITTRSPLVFERSRTLNLYLRQLERLCFNRRLSVCLFTCPCIC